MPSVVASYSDVSNVAFVITNNFYFQTYVIINAIFMASSMYQMATYFIGVVFKISISCVQRSFKMLVYEIPKVRIVCLPCKTSLFDENLIQFQDVFENLDKD